VEADSVDDGGAGAADAGGVGRAERVVKLGEAGGAAETCGGGAVAAGAGGGGIEATWAPESLFACASVN